jgi:hypothetical protein
MVAANEPPRIVNPKRFPYGPFQFSLLLSRGVDFEVLASENLQHWRQLHTGRTTDARTEYVDGEASRFSHRFYAVKAAGMLTREVLGYATVTLRPGFAAISNPFRSPNATIGDIFPHWPDGTNLTRFDSRFYKLKKNEVGRGQWVDPNEPCGAGEGIIFFNPTDDYKTHSFVGEVCVGTRSMPLPAGVSLQGSILPQPGRISTDHKLPVAEGDAIYMFDPDRQDYQTHTFDGVKWGPSEPVIGTGEAFWIAKNKPGHWTTHVEVNTDSVQQ